ncbi:hypothetical protein B0A55_04386 [Friedmanniomyces simplex]|uniref:RlpA-like protein double-psi beta-barrel domain-containing protein n=1 Tax=Friedmanniomyces simplex TaxID=329884 RepID=A0A4U0XKD7_9PEZI|nr:hypothetical protein B0A55_04386 [Friedmanniomyces simplex]
MYSKNILAAGAFLSVVAAVPMVKRDIVWVTQTDEAVVTVPVTTTVWVNPGESVPTSSAATTTSLSHFGHHHSHITSTVQSTVTVSAPASSESSVESSAPAPSSSEALSTSSTSVYVAPTTSSSTSVYVAPTTSSTSIYVAPTPSTSATPTTLSTYVAPAQTSTSTSSAAAASASPSGTTYTGDITHYDVGMGSCGWTNSDSEAVVAIPHGMMANGANPNNNPLCGQYITISYAGAQTQAKIVDTCGGCDGSSIDLSPTLFTTVAPSGNGRVHDVEWWFDGSS